MHSSKYQSTTTNACFSKYCHNTRVHFRNSKNNQNYIFKSAPNKQYTVIIYIYIYIEIGTEMFRIL